MVKLLEIIKSNETYCIHFLVVVGSVVSKYLSQCIISQAFPCYKCI